MAKKFYQLRQHRLPRLPGQYKSKLMISLIHRRLDAAIEAQKVYQGKP